MSQTSFIGGLVRKPELRTSQQNGKTTYFMYLQLAENYQKRDGQGNYTDAGTFYKTVSVSGHVARMIDAANLQPGTRLLVVGDTYSVWRDEYTTKSQQVVPGHFEEQVSATHVGLAFNGNQSANVFKVSSNTSTSSTPSNDFVGQSQNPPTMPDFSSTPTNQEGSVAEDDFSQKFKDFFDQQ